MKYKLCRFASIMLGTLMLMTACVGGGGHKDQSSSEGTENVTELSSVTEDNASTESTDVTQESESGSDTETSTDGTVTEDVTESDTEKSSVEETTEGKIELPDDYWLRDVTKLNRGTVYQAKTERLFTFKCSDSTFNRVEGAYFDGSRLFAAMVGVDSNGNKRTKIVELDYKGNILRESDALDLGDANSITYNAEKGRLVVAHASEQYGSRYSYVDPKTLKITATADRDHPFSVLSYSQSNGNYVSFEANGAKLDTWDGSLKYKGGVEIINSQSALAGIYCTDKYVYMVKYEQNGSPTEVRIYDLSGGLVRFITIETVSSIKPEAIAVVDNALYVICNDLSRGCAALYRLYYVEKKADVETETTETETTETTEEVEVDITELANSIYDSVERGEGINSGIYCKELIFDSVASGAQVAEAFKRNGYTVYECDTVEGAKFTNTVLVRGNKVVTLWWSKSAKQLRVMHESIEYNDLSVLVPNESTGQGAVEVVQVGIERGGENDNPNIGMSYVIKLSNGRAIVIDGGFNNDNCMDNLYDTLVKLGIAKDSYGRYIIEAWIITHAHGDHIGTSKGFCQKYNDRTTVNYYVHNFPGDESVAVDGGVDEAYNDRLFREKYPEAKRVNLHAGLKYYFGNATISVLYTPELVYSMNSTLDYFNDTSPIFKIEAEGASVLFLGDATERAAIATWNAYDPSVFKSNIFQMTHHGLYTGAGEYHTWTYLKNIYGATNAEYAFLPMGTRQGTGTSRNGRYTVLVQWAYAGFQVSYVMNMSDDHGRGGISQAEFDAFVDSVIAGNNTFDTFYGYDGINKIVNASGLVTYTSGSNYDAMVTSFTLSGNKATLTLNETLEKWLK